jgi:hypothetical protein
VRARTDHLIGPRTAAREAAALAAEWVSTYRVTDLSWRASYSPGDLAKLDRALDVLTEHLAGSAGRASAFFRESS